jgi:hypothetical protein
MRKRQKKKKALEKAPTPSKPFLGHCGVCGGSTHGFKCEACGLYMKEFDEKHKCGSFHVLPMCARCEQPETLCSCFD